MTGLTLSRPVAATRTPSTTRLLASGAVAGPLFVGVVLAQAYTRSGFDPARHPLSSLALGNLGWIQIANFLITGLLTLAGAVGLRRALWPGRAATWGPRLVGLNGVAMIVSGVFLTDPINGYPVGTPDTVSWHGIVHSMAPAVAGIAGLVGFVIFGRRFAADRERGWLLWTVVAPLAVLAMDVIALSTTDFRPMLLGQAIGSAWLTSVFLKLLHRDGGR